MLCMCACTVACKCSSAQRLDCRLCNAFCNDDSRPAAVKVDYYGYIVHSMFCMICPINEVPLLSSTVQSDSWEHGRWIVSQPSTSITALTSL